MLKKKITKKKSNKSDTNKKGKQWWEGMAQIGEIRIRQGRRWIKVGMFPNKWMPYARYLWEMEKGEIRQKGYVVHHKDGDPMNDDIKNFELMKNKKHLEYHVKEKKKKTK